MKKRFLAISLISALILSCSAFVIWLMPGKAMAEEGDPPAADPPAVNFEVMGASIRKIAPMGLRFEVKINADAANTEGAELGMYLCPTERLTGGKFTDGQLESNVMDDDAKYATADKYIKKVPIGPDKLIVDPDNNEKMLLRLSLVNLVPSSLDKQFSAMAYIKIGENEQTSDTIERSVAYVARRALADPDPELSPAGEDRRFVEAIVENSNDFYITTDGVSVDKTVVREDKFTHRITLGAEGTKDIELSLDKTFEKDVICRIKLFAKASASGIKINDQPVINDETEGGNGFTEITLDDIQVVNNKVPLHITGGAEGNELWVDDIRAEGMRSLGIEGMELREGYTNAITNNSATLTYNEARDRVEYNAGTVDSGNGNVRFTTDCTVGEGEYLVFKFKYFNDMFFAANSYGDEGLWIKGYDFGAEGGTSTHERDYFSIFDENYYDYTLYMRDGDSSYEGTKLTVPYGSFHGTKELTTTPGTWYYAVAPIAGNYLTIGSYNKGMHIEIADIYSVKEDIKEKLFVPQNYPVHLRVPASLVLMPEDTKNVKDGADGIVALSVNVGADDFECSSTDTSVATVENGVVTAVSPGTCNIEVSLKNSSVKKSIPVEVKNLPEPEKLSGPGIRDLGLSVMRNAAPDENGYIHYSEEVSRGKTYRLNQNARKDEEYLVFQLLYTAHHQFNTTSETDEGLWVMGWRPDELYAWGYEYFAVYDEEGYDYTIYLDYEGRINPYGSHHNDANGPVCTTEAYKWYYIVAPQTGVYDEITYNEPNSDFYISNVYAITQEARDRYFNYQVLPGTTSMPAAVLNVPETLTVGTNYHANLNASLKFAGKDAERMQYTVLEDSTLVTVDENGLVSAGEATGTCTIRVSAVGLTKDCAVTVKELNPAPKLEGSGVTKIDLGRLRPYNEANAGLIEKDEFGYLHYASADTENLNSGKARIMIQNNYCLNPDDYVVFVFKYAEGTVLGAKHTSDEGLWVKAYTDKGEKNYMATFDMEGYDYTIYMGQHGTGDVLSSGAEVNFMEPYGTLHRADENALYDTAADTWYCLVTTQTGANKAVGETVSTYATYVVPFDMTIAGVYTVNETARDRLFKVNLRPGQEMPEPELVAPDRIDLVIGDVTVIKAKTKNIDDPPAIAYAITDAAGNAADTSVIILDAATGKITAQEAGTCHIKVTAGELSKILIVEVTAAFSSGPPKLAAGDTGTVTEIGLGIIKDMPFYDEGYITYTAADGDLTLDPENDLKPTADEYLVIQFGYIDIAFIDDTSNEGIWFQGFGSMATYNESSHYDYFAVFGEDGRDYTIYTQWGKPYGSYHGVAKSDVTTEPNTWYYFVAPNKGLYDSVTLPSFQHSHFNVRIANVYKIDQAYRDAHFIKGHKLFPDPQKLEDDGNDENGKVTEIGLGIITKRKTADGDVNITYDADGYITHVAGDGNLVLDADNANKPTADEYLVIQFGYTDMEFRDNTGDEGIWFKGDGSIATYNTGGKYDYFAVFGEDGKDYTIYRDSDQMPYGSYHNFSKAVTTEPITWYYLVAPNKGMYDTVELYYAQHNHFNVRIANVYKIDGKYKEAHFVKGHGQE